MTKYRLIGTCNETPIADFVARLEHETSGTALHLINDQPNEVTMILTAKDDDAALAFVRLAMQDDELQFDEVLVERDLRKEEFDDALTTWASKKIDLLNSLPAEPQQQNFLDALEHLVNGLQDVYENWIDT